MMPDDNFLFLAWPVSVSHRIDENSPLYDVGAEQLLKVRPFKNLFTKNTIAVRVIVRVTLMCP